MRYATQTHFTGTGSTDFIMKRFADPLSKLSNTLALETDEAIDKLLSFQVEMQVFKPLNLFKYFEFICFVKHV